MKVLTNGAQAKELAWLLEYLQETLESFKEGLEECRRLLARTEPGTTLAMSSVRSEVVKGYVNRVGTEVVKGVSCFHTDITMVLLVLSYYHGSVLILHCSPLSYAFAIRNLYTSRSIKHTRYSSPLSLHYEIYSINA